MSAPTSGPGPAVIAPVAARHASSEQEGGVVRVLLVESEATVRRRLTNVLEGRGMKVAFADDGAQALAYVQRADPDVALVDVTSSAAGGLEVVARMRAATSGPEIVVVTSCADVASAIAAMDAGAYQVLTRPFHSNDAVGHAVAKAAEHRRLADRARRLEQVVRSESSSPSRPEPLDPAHAVLVDLAELPYADAKRRLVALFDDTYTTELLRRTNGNMSEAARRAGLDRSNFRRLLKRRAR